MRTFRRLTRGDRLVGAFLLLTAFATTRSFDPALANDQVTLRLDWTIEGFHLPFIWALDKGYYAAEGIDAKIFEGRGSGNVAQLVGAKTDTFGEADASRTALARGQGAPLKVVAAFIQRSEGHDRVLRSSGINKPEDLIGKKRRHLAGLVVDGAVPGHAQGLGHPGEQGQLSSTSTAPPRWRACCSTASTRSPA